MKFQDENIAYLQRKVPFVVVLVIIFILIVAARLFYLQVIERSHYQELATEVFIRDEEVVAKRGSITDRNGITLADTRLYYEISITPQYLLDKEKVLNSLVALLPLEKSKIEEKLFEARFEAKFKPVVIAEDVPYEWVAKLKQYLSDGYAEDTPYLLSGVQVRYFPLRRYLYPETFAHALGYVREIDKSELKLAQEQPDNLFSMGDLTGAAGLEKAYDTDLKGKDGQFGRVVDARGREVNQSADLRILQQSATVDPVEGLVLQSTLDFKTQALVAKLFEGKKGALVAMDPRTGEIISLYSSPSFDANRITKNIDKKYWSYINLHEDKILFNRTIQAMYPPASTYKIVALAAGIGSGVIDPEKTSFNCPGGLHFGNRFFKCWRSGGHGRVSALRGMGQSCDVFFYQLGLLVGVDGLAKYAKMFGLDAPTGIEIPFEKSGLIPTSEWKKKRFNQDWIESETLSISIGQSYDLVTPLQNAVVASMVANDGYTVKPHLGKALLDTEGNLVREIKHEKIATELVGSKAIEWVKKGMIEVVHGQGTAVRLKQSPYKIAGKTGTAQVISHGSKGIKGQSSEAHALFVAFAPYDDPKIAVSVIVEHGRGGSATAAPIAMQVIDTYLGGL